MDYTHLDPLTSICGEKITTVEEWETFRREEIMVLLENFIYGVRPQEKPDGISFGMLADEMNFKGYDIERKDMTLSFNGYTLPFYVFLPMKREGKLPAFLHILNESSGKLHQPIDNPDNGFIPITDITARGYAVVIVKTYDISPDWEHYTEFRQGVFKAMQPDAEKRNDRSWATISGWAFGASRVMDYLETDPDIDCKRVAVIGHSRAGKTALWATATDRRFAIAISNSSGCSGASFTRGKTGEHIKDINISDWFCGNYHKYDDREKFLPFDQHYLLAAIAPRPIYVKSNELDDWAGPDNELLSCKLATPVYNLYGIDGFIDEGEIEIDRQYAKGNIAYHRTHGDHDLIRLDWKLYMDFADRYLK